MESNERNIAVLNMLYIEESRVETDGCYCTKGLLREFVRSNG